MPVFIWSKLHLFIEEVQISFLFPERKIVKLPGRPEAFLWDSGWKAVRNGFTFYVSLTGKTRYLLSEAKRKTEITGETNKKKKNNHKKYKIVFERRYQKNGIGRWNLPIFGAFETHCASLPPPFWEPPKWQIEGQKDLCYQKWVTWHAGRPLSPSPRIFDISPGCEPHFPKTKLVFR